MRLMLTPEEQARLEAAENWNHALGARRRKRSPWGSGNYSWWETILAALYALPMIANPYHRSWIAVLIFVFAVLAYMFARRAFWAGMISVWINFYALLAHPHWFQTWPLMAGVSFFAIAGGIYGGYSLYRRFAFVRRAFWAWIIASWLESVALLLSSHRGKVGLDTQTALLLPIVGCAYGVLWLIQKKSG